MEKVNFKKISTYYILGTLFNQGFSFITVPIFSRLLSTADYGIVTTFTSWVGMATIVVSGAVYMAVRSSFIDYVNSVDDVISSLNSFTIVNTLFLAIVAYLISLILGIQIPIILFVLCMIHSLGSALIQNYTMLLMMQYRYKLRTFLLVIPNLFSVIVSMILIIFFMKTDLYLGRIVPTALTQGFFGMIVLTLTYLKSPKFWNYSYIRYALKISAPLILHGIALNLLSQSDRVMITIYRGPSETGIYSLIYNFSMIATVITSSLEGIWVPWFINKLKEGRELDINRIAKYYIEFMMVAMGVLILISPEIIKILSDRKYWIGMSIVPPVILANFFIFAYTLYVNVEHYYKKTLSITLNTIIAAVLNIVTNFIFIPKFGYIAAAYSTLFAYFISLLLHERFSKKLNHKLYPISFFLLPFLKLTILVGLYYSTIDYFLCRILIIAVLLIFEMITHKKEIAKAIELYVFKR
ncbi:lipopolysaccharide biosynthesis protein [Streptococcus uberis]|uniref:lipopolysaccharide biosynthesis protein n=1 Tax=Streptococcus uberis TaxID=1349 RepID=UPI001939A8E8|nr:oligosaccharide flippase family protein [Streptococcus uberis]MCK1157870.1 oligosaccharide flippase family protein [Streptococcus uberis]MCK1223522.1 oligosaccharide flippase family protein [Streptococcus uberis]